MAKFRLLKIPGKVPESGKFRGRRSKCYTSSTTSQQKQKPVQHLTSPQKKNKTSSAADADATGKAKFYTDEIKEKFPILYAWLNTMDKLPHLSDGSDSDEDKSEFRYGIHYKPNNDSSDEDNPSTKKSLNDLD